MHLPGTSFLASSLVVEHNAFKNVIFRIATFALDMLILRIFGFLAFRRRDYTSFLMFAEDIIQKALFISSRGITARQSLLVGMFALIATAGEFYDTMLWAIDNPGFVLKHRQVDGATSARQMVKTPAYVVIATANRTSPSTENTLDTAVGGSLYASGFNYSLPGIFQEGSIEVAPPLYSLSSGNSTARIWLDDEGFAVGLDFTMMTTLNMTLSNSTGCVAYNADPESNTQVWNCNIPNSEASAMLQKTDGLVPVWWDLYHPDELQPNIDNPWGSLGSGQGSAMMKQVFTVTKGVRRHTFKSTVIKASMSTPAPGTLDDGEITDFMRRTWSPDGTISTGVQDVINVVLQAKGNRTGRTFGEFIQTNTSLLAIRTDYLNDIDVATGNISMSVLRTVITNTTLIRSETLAQALTPFQTCPGTVYSSRATGGEAISSNCNIAAATINQTMPLNRDLFLGQLDASTVGIFFGFLGDGTSNLSSVALTQPGLDWITQEQDHIDNVLISRALLLGGNSSAVTVDVAYSVAAISGLQLLLSLLPVVLAILAWGLTRAKAISYYQNSFLAAVLTTTHTIVTPTCEELGRIHSMPEITLQSQGRHVYLQTPNDGRLTNTIVLPMNEQDNVYETSGTPQRSLKTFMLSTYGQSQTRIIILSLDPTIIYIVLSTHFGLRVVALPVRHLQC